jgi:hypothetical protein
MALGLVNRPALPVEREKTPKRPRIQVRALVGGEDAPSTEWGSLLEDLTRTGKTAAQDDEALWQVHDKTHLEFSIDYAFGSEPREYSWEAYFFVPESLRLRQTTYDKKQIYDDLLSYVRLAVPEMRFDDIANACEKTGVEGLVSRLRKTLLDARGKADGSPESRAALRRARVLACMVRASGLDAQREMLAAIEATEDPEAATRHAHRFSNVASRIVRAFREVVEEAGTMDVPEEIRVALAWVDEDMSLFIEALYATASVRVNQKADGRDDWETVAARLASEAVAEARYRKEREYPSVGAEDATEREVEHIEFRRHVLKRFTSSVLWLRHEVRDAGQWVLHALYALVAAVAMAFAVWVTLRATELQGKVSLYFALLVASYAAKDRMKAMLQTYFSRLADKRFADRKWTIRDEERDETVGLVAERAGFEDFKRCPPEVLAARRMTREHALEESARPETVLWHEKNVTVEPRKAGTLPSPMMTEIFRLNIGQWLAHTDDPNRTITFADPDNAVVCTVNARRVYNINVVYRLKGGDEAAPWRRIRVVVSRKGIERIDTIA